MSTLRVKHSDRVWQCGFCRQWIEADEPPVRCQNCGNTGRISGVPGFRRLREKPE